RHEIPARLLKLGITERAVMAHGGRELDTLADLHALGVLLSLRGFGAGYSSLAQLKRLPVAELKIDPAFTRNLLHDDNDAAIVGSVIHLAHNLGWTVVGEAIDVPALAERLAAI